VKENKPELLCLPNYVMTHLLRFVDKPVCFFGRFRQINKFTNKHVMDFLQSTQGACWAFDFASAHFNITYYLQKLFHQLRIFDCPNQWLTLEKGSQLCPNVYISITLFIDDIRKLDPNKIQQAKAQLVNLPTEMIKSIELTSLASVSNKQDLVEEIKGFKKRTVNYINLSNADLEGIDLSYRECNGLNFYKANLRKAILGATQLFAADLSASNLEGVICRDAYFKYANLTHAICTKADFTNSNMEKAICKNTDFTDADLSGVDLSTTNTENAILPSNATAVYCNLI
jgi:uncharacterized protein YjbI with pentapeptide repeats